MSLNSNEPFLILVNYGCEGWSVETAATFNEAVKLRDERLGWGNSEVVIAEYIPLKIQDGRSVKTIPEP